MKYPSSYVFTFFWILPALFPPLHACFVASCFLWRLFVYEAHYSGSFHDLTLGRRSKHQETNSLDSWLCLCLESVIWWPQKKNQCCSLFIYLSSFSAVCKRILKLKSQMFSTFETQISKLYLRKPEVNRYLKFVWQFFNFSNSEIFL